MLFHSSAREALHADYGRSRYQFSCIDKLVKELRERIGSQTDARKRDAHNVMEARSTNFSVFTRKNGEKE